MGHRLAIAIVVGTTLLGGVAHAQRTPRPPPPPQTAAEFAKVGTDLYKAGDYAGAVAPLLQAHTLEAANFDYRLALAHALRQNNQCEEALPHYKALREGAPDQAIARDVRDSMALCPGGEIKDPPPPLPPPPPAPPPQIIVKQVPPKKTDLGLMYFAGGAIGGGIGLWIASINDASDADAARSAKDHDAISSRVTGFRVVGSVLLVAGVGLGTYTLVKARKEAESTEVAVTPTSDGAAVVVSGSW